jgi:mono/diheme cytochrome c family protein
MPPRSPLHGLAVLALIGSVASGCKPGQPPAEDLVRGMQVYQADCAVCHGDHGAGDGPLAARLVAPGGRAPESLADSARIAGLGRDGLRESLTSASAHTRSGSAMPVWGPHLGPELTERVLDYLLTLPAQDEAVRRGVRDYLGGGVEAARQGRRLYVQYCSGCHGPYGRGDALMADPLRKELGRVDLAESRVAALSDGELRALIGSGGAHAAVAPTMPGWIGTLSPAQIDEIAGYLRSIAPAGSR